MSDRPREYATFCNDTLFRRGVERNMEIMRETMNQVLKNKPRYFYLGSQKDRVYKKFHNPRL